MTSDDEEGTQARVLLSRPRDESLEAYKDWIGELFTHITGKPMTGDRSMSEEEWKRQHAEFWHKMHAEAGEE
jgi:hypothetical protein